MTRSAWEPVPANAAENAAIPADPTLPQHPDFNADWQARSRPRVTGSFTGTTDEIIQWAACKWGLDDDLLRAQATAESTWRMDAEGDWETASRGHCVTGETRDPCPVSFGILQNKWYYNPGSYPRVKQSTAFSLDFSAAKLRGCFDGMKWIDRVVHTGDLWGCVGNWWSGRWYDPGAIAYVQRVVSLYEEKPWLRWRG